MTPPRKPATHQSAPGQRPARRRPARARRSREAWWWALGIAVLAALGIAVLATRPTPAPSATTGGAPPATSSSPMPTVGQLAPAGSFRSTSGATISLASLRGRPALLWLVTTWCSSCQAGTQTVAQRLPALTSHHVKVIELELYKNLGGPPQSVAGFARQYAGAAAHNAAWTFGNASKQLSLTYDPQAYLDVYYLIGPNGHIRYVNSSPSATIGNLLAQTAKLPA